jgi:hypothetical protein
MKSWQIPAIHIGNPFRAAEAVPKWRFSAAKVTRPLLTFTDKLTGYRQKNVLVFLQLGRSGDAPVPRHPRRSGQKPK